MGSGRVIASRRRRQDAEPGVIAFGARVRARGVAWRVRVGMEESFLPSRGRARGVSRANPREVRGNALTLGLVMFGGAIFPLAFAFSLTGLALGFAVVVTVALLNDYTCCVLLRAARRCHDLGARDADGSTLSFEELARFCGGAPALALARVALVALLFGTNCGGLAVIGEAGGRALCGAGLITGGDDPDAACAPAPAWIRAYHPRLARHLPFPIPDVPAPANPEDAGVAVAVALTLLVLAPLCLARDITSLDRAGAVGLALLLTLVVALVSRAAHAGFPAAVQDPDAFAFRAKGASAAARAFPILGYAFYVHPVLLPMLTEMTARERAEGRSRRRRRRRRAVEQRHRGATTTTRDDVYEDDDDEEIVYPRDEGEIVAEGGTHGENIDPVELDRGDGSSADRSHRGSGAWSGVGRASRTSSAVSSDVFFDAADSLRSFGAGYDSDLARDSGGVTDAAFGVTATVRIPPRGAFFTNSEGDDADDEAALMEGGDAADGDASSGDGDASSGFGAANTPRFASAASRAASSLERSVHLCLAFAVVAYVTIGACGYALYGDDTRDNVLLNMRSPALDAAMTVYQALCFPPTFHSLRASAYALVDGADAGFPNWYRAHVPRVAGMLAAALIVAARMPHSAFLFAITGAVGVCAVCYAFPVWMHLRVRRRCRGDADSGSGERRGDGGTGWGGACGGWAEFAVPTAALAGGVALSAAGLYTTLARA